MRYAFIVGFFCGIILIGTLTLVKPLWFNGVQSMLVEYGHGHYNEKTRAFVLDECKK